MDLETFCFDKNAAKMHFFRPRSTTKEHPIANVVNHKPMWKHDDSILNRIKLFFYFCKFCASLHLVKQLWYILSTYICMPTKYKMLSYKFFIGRCLDTFQSIIDTAQQNGITLLLLDVGKLI